MKSYSSAPAGGAPKIPSVLGRPARTWEWLWKKKHVCPWWLARIADTSLRERFHPPREILGPYLKPDMTALDLGCGAGFFSLAMARVVGPGGTVLAADIQPRMLRRTVLKAQAAGLATRIEPLLLEGGGLILDRGLDFGLAFWMAHEVTDLPLLLGRVHHHLNPGGRFLLAEPLVHVSGKRFKLETLLAMETGLRIESEPKVRFSRAVVLRKN